MLDIIHKITTIVGNNQQYSENEEIKIPKSENGLAF
jgi:hypothetical protein